MNEFGERLGDKAAETLLFRTYLKRYGRLGFDIPALVPQVYLHYDPCPVRQRGLSRATVGHGIDVEPAQGGHQGDGGAVPVGVEGREGRDSRRVVRADRLAP